MSPERSGVCAWCGAKFRTPSRRGPAPRYCSGAHRQAAHRDRHRVTGARPTIGAELAELRSRVEELERRVGGRGAKQGSRP